MGLPNPEGGSSSLYQTISTLFFSPAFEPVAWVLSSHRISLK